MHVSKEDASSIIKTRSPRGVFVLKEGDTWIGIDNRAGDAWTEEFKDQETCIAWLRGEIEMSDSLEDMESVNNEKPYNI
jgi:hypothetical protein